MAAGTAIYTRISRDPEGRKAGVARQRDDCEAFCRDRGWEFRVFEDDDRSAYSGAPRPAYEELLGEVQAGTVVRIVVWESSRLYRRPRELEDLIDLVEERGVAIHSLNGGEYDLATVEGRMMARVAATVDRAESERKSERQRRKKQELAAEGRWSGGIRPFGYGDPNLERQTTETVHRVNEVEADLVREAAHRILAGESPYAVANDWADRGIATVKGGRWHRNTLVGILRSSRIAGLREHRGEVVGEAEWPAILDRPTWERVRRTLDGRSTPVRHHGNRTYLLTGGLAVCGVCGSGLVARPRGTYRRYVCPSRTRGGCGGVSVTADGLEEAVRDAVLAALDGPSLTEALRAASGDDEREARTWEALEGAEAFLDQIAEDFGSGQVSRREYLRMREAAVARAERARRDLAATRNGSVVADLPDGGVREAWESRGLEWRRALVSAVAETIVVNPVGHTANRFDPSRVDIRWRA